MEEPGAAQRARVRLVGDIVASLAHDLGQPLNVIRLTAENALSGEADEAADRTGFATIGQQAEQMLASLERLVRLLRGRQPTRTIDVVASVTAAVTDRQSRFDSEAVTLEWQPPEGGAWSRGVPEHMALVLGTLLDNAREAVLNARMTRPAGGIRIACSAGDGEVAITVNDDGPGMPDSVAAAILDPRTSADGPRAGIGLMLTAGIVATMGGTMSIDAGPAGTDVTIHLPQV